MGNSFEMHVCFLFVVVVFKSNSCGVVIMAFKPLTICHLKTRPFLSSWSAFLSDEAITTIVNGYITTFNNIQIL